MLDWLKTILGEAYTEEIDKQVSAEIGKSFVSKADFNAINDTKKELEAQLNTANEAIQSMQEKAPDVEAIQQEAATYKAQAEQAKADADARAQAAEMRAAAIEAASSIAFTSKGAKTAYITALLEKGLPFSKGAFTGVNDFTAEYKESDPEAFKEDNGAPQLRITTPSNPPAPGSDWREKLNTNYQKAKVAEEE